MKQEWKKIFSSKESYKVELLKNLLEEHGIPVIISNKQDSMYPVIGEVELHTTRENVVRALNLIKKSEA